MQAVKGPNFFVVGAGKAGTTSLYRYLGQHPRIYMCPIKEPSFFASEVRAENLSDAFLRRDDQRLLSDWNQYLQLFRNVTDEPAIGEATPSYLWSPTAPANIHSRVPDAKIVMILRDPAERAFSHYLHQLAEGLTRMSFREQIESCARGSGGKLSVLYPFLEIGLYHQQVKRYLDLFPRRHIRIYWYEEAWRQPKLLLSDLFAFLNVDASFEPDLSLKSLERRAPRLTALHYFLKNHDLSSRLWNSLPDPVRAPIRQLGFRRGGSLTMNPIDRKYLVDYYRDDIQKLAALLDRDLSSWVL